MSVHGWNDPMDPEETYRHRVTPMDDRPPYPPFAGSTDLPRDSYPVELDAPAAGSGFPAYPSGAGRHAAGQRPERYDEFGRHESSPGFGAYPPFDGSGHHDTAFPANRYDDTAFPARYDDTAFGGPARADGTPEAVGYPVNLDDESDGSDGSRHRVRPRFSRTTALIGAAATATLALMVGVGVMLPSSSDSAERPPSADGPVLPTEAGPLGLDDAPLETPSGSPSAVPTPSATRTARPSPSAIRRTSATKRRPTSSPTTRKPSGGGGGTSQPVGGTQAQQVVALVNQERAAAGCGAVTANGKLTTAAQLHSADQAAHDTMSHTGSDGSDFVVRAKRAGYTSPIGENVAMGYRTPQEVMNGWMNSPGHRANILNCAAKAIGVGVAKASDGTLYWTQVFGSA